MGGDSICMESLMNDKSMDMSDPNKSLKDGACLLTKQGRMYSRERKRGFLGVRFMGIGLFHKP